MPTGVHKSHTHKFLINAQFAKGNEIFMHVQVFICNSHTYTQISSIVQWQHRKLNMQINFYICLIFIRERTSEATQGTILCVHAMWMSNSFCMFNFSLARLQFDANTRILNDVTSLLFFFLHTHSVKFTIFCISQYKNAWELLAFFKFY